MPKIVKEIISEKLKKVENIQKQKKQLLKEIRDLKAKKCSFCQKLLPTNRNNYLKNRYKLAFWNNQKADERLICYACLRYGWVRGLPFVDGTKTNPDNPKGSWSKARTFRRYQKLGYFKENDDNKK